MNVLIFKGLGKVDPAADEPGYFDKGRFIPVQRVCGTCRHMMPYLGFKPIPEWDGFCGRFAEKNHAGVRDWDTCKYWRFK